jgi:ubiquinone/menaquinone biosynthesis C-methylase UbiE
MVQADSTPEELETLQTYNELAGRWDEIAHAHWKDGEWYRWLSKLPPRALVLDIGCGTGRDAELCFSDNLRYVGIDYSIPMLEIARKNNADKNGSDVAFAGMDMKQLAFRSECFDGFRAITTFMHIPRHMLLGVLLGVRRVLKPGAHGAVSVPNGTFAGMYEGKRDVGGRTYSVCWSPNKLDRVLADAGFLITASKLDHTMHIRHVQKI